jgi:hypothetical protein
MPPATRRSAIDLGARGAHQHDEGRPGDGQRVPVEQPVGRRVLVRGDDRDPARFAAHGHRDPGGRGPGDARRDAGDDLDRDPVRAQLSASSPPRPNTNGSPPLSRTTVSNRRPTVDEDRVDLVLGVAAGARVLPTSTSSAQGRPRRARARRPAGRARSRRPCEQRHRAHGQQVRVARAGAHEVHGHDVTSFPSPRRHGRGAGPRRGARRDELEQLVVDRVVPAPDLGRAARRGQLVADVAEEVERAASYSSVNTPRAGGAPSGPTPGCGRWSTPRSAGRRGVTTDGRMNAQFAGSSAELTNTFGRLAVARHLGVDRRIVRGGDREPVGRDLAAAVLAPVPADVGVVRDLGHGVGRHHGHDGTGARSPATLRAATGPAPTTSTGGRAGRG